MFASLVKQIGAKPAKARNEVGEIHFVVLFQPFFQVGRHDGVDDLIYPLEGRRGRLDGNEPAVDAENDRPTHFQVNVRGAAFNGGLQNAMK